MSSVNEAQPVLNYQSQERGSDAAFQGAWISLALLLGINLFNYVDRQILSQLEPDIQKSLFPKLGPNDPTALRLMGYLPTAFIVSYMVLSPLFGWLAERFSRWLLIGISVILWSLATGGSGLAMTFAAMLTMRLFVGVGEAGYGPAAPTIIADLFPLKKRGSVLAWFYMAIPIGSALGYIAGDIIGPRLGWQKAFFAVTPPGLILGCLCFFMKNPKRGQADAGATVKRHAGLADYLMLFKTPSYVLDTAGMAAMTFAICGIAYWMPKYMDVRNVGEHAGLIFGIITAASGLLATLLGGMAGDALRKRYSGSYFLVSGVGILLACPFILLIVLTPFPAAWIMIFLAEFCLFFNTGPSNAILANVTHPAVRATAFGINIFVLHALGDATSSPILGEVAGKFGWNAAFYVVTAVTALGGVFWIWGIRYLAADAAAAPHRLDAIASNVGGGGASRN